MAVAQKSGTHVLGPSDGNTNQHLRILSHTQMAKHEQPWPSMVKLTRGTWLVFVPDPNLAMEGFDFGVLRCTTSSTNVWYSVLVIRLRVKTHMPCGHFSSFTLQPIRET